MGLLPCVNERMSLQIATPVERFVAPLTNIFFYSSMGSLVTSKALPACKCLGAQVTRYLFGHFQLSLPLCPDSLLLLVEVAKTRLIALDHFPFHNAFLSPLIIGPNSDILSLLRPLTAKY